MSAAFIGLGSNLGDRAAHLRAAVEALAALPWTKVTQASRIHETNPVGGPPQGRYLNQVVQLETRLGARALLARLQGIERALGRPADRPVRWAARTLDMDLLSYDDQVRSGPDLELPHPRMHERPFVLVPLSEIAPGWRHPRLGYTVGELLSELRARFQTALSFPRKRESSVVSRTAPDPPVKPEDDVVKQAFHHANDPAAC